MALGKELGDFSFSITSVTYAEDGATYVSVDGTATSYGTVLGTLIIKAEPGEGRGTAKWIGEGFLDDGNVVRGSGDGTFEEIGKHVWRTRLVITVSDGATFASDGRIDLASRSYNGKNLSWD